MVYEQEQAISDFIQTDPIEGGPATEKTELWVMFDRENVYVAFRVWESQRERRVANVMQKDNGLLFQNDGVMFVFDPFYDRRNGVGFMLNAIGGRTDGQVTDERWSRDWNMVWDVKVADFDGGWTAEVALPFKSLRYRPGTAQVWGFNARRIDRWKNEYSHLMPVERQEAGSGVYRMSRAATVIGLEAPPGSKNLEFKPYAISNASSIEPRTLRTSTAERFERSDGRRRHRRKVRHHPEPDRRLHRQHRLRPGRGRRAADQPHALQPVLPREARLLPRERRALRLRRRQQFQCGPQRRAAALLQPANRAQCRPGRADRRRRAALTGRVGRYSVGVIDIQTGSEAVSGTRATNFSAVRVKRDVLSRSSIGVIATGRSVTQDGAGSNAAYGVDGAFGFFTNLAVDAYWARTATDGLSGSDTSYRGVVNYNGLTYGLQAERLVIGEHFNPEVGFVRRGDIRKSFAQARYSPWPTSIGPVRRISLVGSIGYVENGARQLEARDIDGEFADRLQHRRPGLGRLCRQLRTGAAPVPHRDGRHGAGGRLRLRQHDRRVPGGTAAEIQRPSLARSRVALRRHQDDARAEHRPRDAVAAALGRAHLLGERRRLAAGLVRDDADRLARDLHDDAADVRERAGAVQLRRPQRRRRTSGCGGNTGPAANCSSSTTRNATR